MINLRSLSSQSSYLFTLCFKTGNFLVNFKFLFLQNFVIKLQSSGLVFRFGERIFFGLKDISGKAALRKDFLLKQLIFIAADEKSLIPKLAGDTPPIFWSTLETRRSSASRDVSLPSKAEPFCTLLSPWISSSRLRHLSPHMFSSTFGSHTHKKMWVYCRGRKPFFVLLSFLPKDIAFACNLTVIHRK